MLYLGTFSAGEDHRMKNAIFQSQIKNREMHEVLVEGEEKKSTFKFFFFLF